MNRLLPVLVPVLAALLGSCGTVSREHRVTRKTTAYEGTVKVPLPTAEGIRLAAIPVQLTVTEDTDEDATAESESKMDPAVKGALLALAEKGAGAAIPGGGSIFQAFSHAFAGDSSGGLGGLLPLAGGAAGILGSGLVALKKAREAEQARRATADAVSFGRDALALDPKDAVALEALKEKHRLRQVARGTNDAIKSNI